MLSFEVGECKPLPTKNVANTLPAATHSSAKSAAPGEYFCALTARTAEARRQRGVHGTREFMKNTPELLWNI
jgi:hypothetical protein